MADAMIPIRFTPEVIQQANFRTSEQFRAYRCRYMRQYRRDEILRNIRARERARSRVRRA